MYHKLWCMVHLSYKRTLTENPHEPRDDAPA